MGRIRLVFLSGLFFLPFAAWADGEGAPAPIPTIWWVAPAGAVAALFFARRLFSAMKSAPAGNETMIRIAGHVRRGAMAYLRQQYKVVGLFFVIVCLLLAVLAYQFHAQSKWVPWAFLTGGFFSGLAGFVGMHTATLASSRTAQGASESLNRGLQVAFRAGAVMGLTVVGLGLFDICAWFFVLYKMVPQVGGALGLAPLSLNEITVTMLCFGMGASSQALFARVGGGIFTKAADVGADLVGKIEAGIPEDDPRNPATIADNVGDNVGDVAGMGADLYESYCGSILATAALGVAAAAAAGLPAADQIRFLCAPMVLAGVGIFLSILGIYLVRTKEGASLGALLWALRVGVWVPSVLIAVAAYFVVKHTLPPQVSNLFYSILTGLVSGVVIGYFTEYFTASEYRPTQRIASAAKTGPATVIIAGIAEGMFSTWIPISVIGVGTMIAFGCSGGFHSVEMGLYGIGFAAVGMLATLGVTLATDAYGPIADNAGGNAEMSHLGPEVRKRTDALDSLGNTTAATGKGFAIGSAALTALALLASYVEEVREGQRREAKALCADAASGTWVTVAPARRYACVEGEGAERAVRAFLAVPGERNDATAERLLRGAGPSGVPPVGVPEGAGLVYLPTARMAQFMTFYEVHLMNPKVLVGMFFGVLLVFLFCAMTMQAVGRAAMSMVDEVRRQFREIAGILEGKAEPDYARCVAISTAGAQREMIVPSLLAIVIPVGVGLVLGVPGVMGLLVGGLCSGFALAVFMANAGGAWDNAKKYIEAGNHGGKGSAPHKAAVVGDTVGDPFKDTSGPSLNILVKLMSMVAIVFAGVTVTFAPRIAAWLGM
ncbi:MAG: sodium-translocating pyrophosphatase [Planctomycetes bacterium]|nr:sodium-translocating pyrophosphatase [Planctomycetota bacterium]